MVRAREAILAAGGAQACNSFTRFYLALLGQISYDDCPSVPPELVLVPSRLGLQPSAMSSWTRTIVVPLSIISAFKPVRRLAPEQGIAELFRDDLPRQPARRTRQLVSWTNFFLGLDRLLKWADRRLPRSWREPGIRAAHRWMLEHFENSDGLGAIFPPMIYTVIALECLGYEPDSAPVQWALRQLEDLLIEEDGKVRVQPCVSPIWDTAIATIALADARLPDFHPALLRAVRWLLDKEVRGPGDWQVRRPGVEPSGWHFQFHNELYPDIDDTAMVLLALQRTALADSPEVKAATAARRQLAARDAEPRRRLGGLRRRHRQRGPDQGPVRRPQRDARPELRRHHGAGPRDPGDARLPRRPPGGRAGARLPLADPGAAGLLVRPLGGQLHLRDLAGPAGPQGARLPDGPPRAPEGGRLARVGPAGRRRLGRVVPELRRPAAGWARASRPPRRPPGPCSA